jgi:putative intracellular protease/amidase
MSAGEVVAGLVVAAVVTTAPLASAAPASGAHTRNVAIVVYEGVEVLDFAGPSEVFAAAGGYAGLAEGQRAFKPYTVAVTKDPVLSQGFVRIAPEFSIDDAPKPDILVLPGGNTGNLLENPRFMAWVTKAMQEAEVTLTVCTGAFVAGKAGMLDGRTATTWYNAVEALRKATPKATVQEGRRFVDNGPVVTTAGVSAGIDGALHVVARLVGRSAADRTARYMEYHWTPESYLAKGYSHLNPGLDDAGRAVQEGLLLEDEGRFERAVSVWRGMTAADASNAFAWYRLGSALHALKRYDEAVEAARHVTSGSLRAGALFNIACARAQQGRKEEALTALEDAVKAGFKARYALQGDTDLDSIRGEARFQDLLSRVS